ncbi:MAG: DUF362 domain-containing protein [Deltaproteobacteria bacterium]|nr:DUF362 domain-containing protein [Deltaproteobacteria bacterium]
METKRNRREFLQAGLLSTAAAMVGGASGIVGVEPSYGGEHPDLVVCHGKDPGKITRSAVDQLGGMKRFVKAGQKVVIKPNMSFASGPERGANTHPAVVREVAQMCAEAGASRISVVDYVLNEPSACLSLSKIPEYCQGIPNTTVNHVKAKRLFREVPVRNGNELKSLEVLAEVLDSDVLIAVPVGKSHSAAGVSLSMKGMMGLIYDRISFHGRYDLHNAIVDMVSVVKPALVVMDATRILSTGGPSGPGKVIPMDMVIASPDMVAADAQMVTLGTWYDRKFTPNQVRHIRIASERGLGRMDLANLKVATVQS